MAMLIMFWETCCVVRCCVLTSWRGLLQPIFSWRTLSWLDCHLLYRPLLWISGLGDLVGTQDHRECSKRYVTWLYWLLRVVCSRKMLVPMVIDILSVLDYRGFIFGIGLGQWGFRCFISSGACMINWSLFQSYAVFHATSIGVNVVTYVFVFKLTALRLK